MNPEQPPTSAPQKDGVSQGHNSSAVNGAALGAAATGDEEWRGKGELRLNMVLRGKRARVKQGMRSSCGRARRWRDNLVNLSNKGMSPNELLKAMQQKHKANRDYTNAELEEMLGKVLKKGDRTSRGGQGEGATDSNEH